MWMMGYNDHHHHGGGGELKDSFNITTARKLRPLIPRPLHQQQQQQQQQPTNPNNNINNNFQTTQQYHQLVSNTNTNTTEYHHHHQNMMMMMSKKELNIGQQVVVSSRWNPTPEQLRALEELYRRGTRTPSAEQIQHITAQLRRYGKIEGKNVFYWFQNHKARERQKRRRQIMESSSSSSLSPDNDNQNHQEEMTLLEGSNNINKTKNWVPTSTSTNTLLEECNVSIERSGKATGESDQWTHHHHDHHHHQFNQGELQQQQQQQHRRNFITERNATWQTMQLSCLPLLPTTCHVITTTNNNPNPNPNPNITTTAATSLLLTTTSTMGQRQSLLNYNYNNKNNNIDIFKTTPYRDENYHEEEEDEDHEDEEESQTLELFPLRSGNYYNTEKENDVSANGIATSVTTTNTTTCQFIEFLPLKQ